MEFTPNSNLYKWQPGDVKGATIAEMAKNMDKIDEQLAEIVTNVKNFGAKGDGVTDDTVAINNAIEYANANGYSHVFLPGKHMVKQVIRLKSNVVLSGNGSTSELIINEPIYRIEINGVENVTLKDFKISKHGSKVVLVKGGSKNIKINNVRFESNYMDFAISTCINLETCSNVTVDGCYFYKTGYQVLQENGFASNNVIVQNCISEKCFQDFVELNSEERAISRNWIIRNNRVYDVGMYQTTNETTTFGYKVYHWTDNLIANAITEGRFFGMTWCDNVLVEGNIVENVGGDSAIHIECPMNVTIKDNTIKNAHSSVARFLYSLLNNNKTTDNTLQSYNVPEGEQKLTVKDNTFILDNSFNLTNDAQTYMLLVGQPRSGADAFTNFGTNNHFVIENNKLFYYEKMSDTAPYTGYPRIPATKYGTGLQTQYCYANVYIEKNLFQGLNAGIDLYPARKDNNIFGSYIDKNKFNSCNTAMKIDEHAVWSFENNSFTNCGNALTYTNKPYSFIQKAEGNHFYNTPVTGLNVLNSTQRKNKYVGTSTTDDFTENKSYPATTTTVTLASLPKSTEQQFRGQLIVSARSKVTGGDKYTTAIYNISYYFYNISAGYHIGQLSLINKNVGSTKVTDLTASLDLTNGNLTATVTTTEDYEISCAIVGF